MPGNWDTYQHLKDGKVEWPKGDTDVNAMVGFEPWRVEAWVVQGVPSGTGKGASFTGPSQSTSSSGSGQSPYRWTADTPGWIQGSFQEGPAVGIAFVASRSTTEPDTFKFNWWAGTPILHHEDAIIDDEFIKRFNDQLAFLEDLEKQVSEAVAKARGRIAKMQPGISKMKDVFG